MALPTTSLLLSKTTPAAPAGQQNVVFQSDGATPQQSVSANVPNSGGTAVKTAGYTAVAGDNGTLLAFNSASAVTLTLPAAPPSAMWRVAVQNVGAGVLTVSRNGLLIDTAAANLVLGQNSGVLVYTDGTNYFTERGASPSLVGVVGLTIDGGGSVPATGAKGVVQVPYAGTITGWTLIGDVSGSAQITVSKATYAGFPTVASIVASAPPNLSSAQKSTSTTLTGWTTAVAAGDILSFNLDSITTCTRLVLELQIARS